MITVEKKVKSKYLSRHILIPGQKFHKLTFIKETEFRVNKQILCLVKCDCGTEKLIRKHDLIFETKSCGCLTKERIGNLNKLKPQEAAFNSLFHSYKTRAQKLSVEFKLTIEQFRNIINRNCIYCNKSPSNNKKSANGILVYNGIDRLNNNLGYTIDNTEPCCGQCNKMKLTYSWEEFVHKIIHIYTNITKSKPIENLKN